MATNQRTLPYFNQTLFEQYTQNLNHCIQNHENRRAIRDATNAIDQIIHSQLLTLLDIRAHAYILQLQPEAAIADVQNMIFHVPELSNGYVLKGDILSMYGHQQQAIDVYNSGLQNIKLAWGDQPTTTGIKEIQKLESRIKEANVLNNRRIDFFSRLPVECVYDIISYLSLEEKVTCVLVNNTWRQRVFECIDISTWEDFFVEGDREDKVLVKAIPYFAHLTKTLTVDTYNKEVCGDLLKHMADGCFKNIDCLKTTLLGSYFLQKSKTLLFDAFCKTKETLRCLELQIGYRNLCTIKLADILSICNRVETVYFSTETCPMAWYIGDFKKMDQHPSLKNLELKSEAITRNDIETLIQNCPHLQRLVLRGCDSTVFYPVIHYALNLKIFASNPLSSSDVPEIQQLTTGTCSSELRGLRFLHAFDEEGLIPINNILRLVYKNRATLTAIQLGMSDPSPHMPIYEITCPDFRLQRLVNLSVWGRSQLQEILFKKIQGPLTLTTLNGEYMANLKTFANNVEKLPSLVTLNIKDVDSLPNQTYGLQLFETLANRSKLGLPSLYEIKLQNVYGMNDAMLATLGDIKTLQTITLERLLHVSTTGITILIQKLGCQLANIRFVDMDTVTDDVMIALCGSSNLAIIDLENIKMVTRSYLQYLSDNSISSRLSKVRVKGCPAIGRDAVFRFTPIQ